MYLNHLRYAQKALAGKLFYFQLPGFALGLLSLSLFIFPIAN